MIKSNLKHNRGFTLLEMIVSLGIFAVVAVIAVGALLRISDANRKALILKTAVNNLNFALETMSREMRFGSNFSCAPNINSISRNGQTTNCFSNDRSWVIAFNSQYEGAYRDDINNRCNLVYVYAYNKADGTLKKNQSKYCDDEIQDSTRYFDVVSPDINIIESDIAISTANQPRVFIWLKGRVGSRARDEVVFSVQTTVSQRAI